MLSQYAHSQSETMFICQFSPPCENLSMDTTLEGNIWQLGSSSDKPGFDHLFPYEHCLMTDSLSSYPVNNHSAFILKYEKSDLDEST